MHRPIASFFGIAGGLVLVAVVAANTAPRAQAMDRTVAPFFADTVTGCLQKGSSTTVYKLVEKNGQAINVKSTSVQLGGHVGHLVTLTTSGTPMAGDTSAVTVTKMAMVSATCPTG